MEMVGFFVVGYFLRDVLNSVFVCDANIILHDISKHTAFLNCPTDFIQLMNKMKNVPVLKYSEIGEKIFLTDKTMVEIDNPAMMPSPQVINYIEEPYVKASIMTPNEYIGSIMELCQSKRG